MKYKAVFFDFDGTLMDTSEGILDCGRRAMEAENQPIPQDARWDLFIGPPLAMCFQLACKIDDRDILSRLCKTYRKFYFAEGQFKAKFYNGIEDLLKELKNRGYRIACASMKYEELVESMCSHFGIRQYFDVILGLDETEKNTKELLIRRGCQMMGLTPDQAVLIGDTDFDKDGAEKAGCGFIPVGWGFGFKPDKDGVFNSTEDILKSI